MLQQSKQFSLTKISQLFLWRIFKITTFFFLIWKPEIRIVFQFPLEQVTEVIVLNDYQMLKLKN